jgi:hypothetical protein
VDNDYSLVVNENGFRQEGLYTFVRRNVFYTNPPLCIAEQHAALDTAA